MPDPLVTFRGSVSCRRAAAPLGLTLIGGTPDRPGERTALAFSAAAPAGFPDALEGAVVERLGAQQYRIVSPPHEWVIAAAAVHLHREIAAQFYHAIPPRPVPLAKRVFWRVVLTLATSRAGLAALRVLRR
ncbi:MAG TPA: hypothetical protein VGD47_07755 [Steroidobacteraceae bacterium]